MFTTIKFDGQQPYAFNPVDAARTEPEFLVQMLERMLDEKFSTENRAGLLAIVAALPEGATMLDLFEAIKAQEAASLGITPEQYEALSPLLVALRGMQEEGALAGLFDQSHG